MMKNMMSMVAVVLVVVSMVGCGKAMPVGTYISEYGEVLGIRELGESHVVEVWSVTKDGMFEPGPHASSPIALDEEGNLVTTGGTGQMKLVPTENGLTLFVGSTAIEYTPIDLTAMPEPKDESARVQKRLEEEIESKLVAPVRDAGRLRCDDLGMVALKKKYYPHLVEALEAAKVEGFSTSRQVAQLSTIYTIEGTLRIPAHTSVREGKKCVKYQKTLMGRRCAKRKKATYEVKSPAFELPIIAEAAMPKKLAPKSPEKVVMRLKALGKIKMSSSISSQLCRHYVRPEKKSVIQEEELEAI